MRRCAIFSQGVLMAQNGFPFSVESFAQFERANVLFKDLTVFVGPQATGKSLLLQLFKLAVDAPAIRTTLSRYGIVVTDPNLWAEAYFGEGFSPVWTGKTRWRSGSETELQTPKDLFRVTGKGKENVFYIPAQRALIFHQASWPRPFSDFRWQDPYVVRYFSEQIRLLLDAGLGGEEGVIFPRERRLDQVIRTRLERNVFRGTALGVVTDRGQKRLVLQCPNGGVLPYLSWSSGQREFVPLLLGVYWLLPLGRQNRRQSVRWVVIEEPEMGLHPEAIEDVLLLVLKLVQRGYKVVLSTHSPTVLDLLWAWSFLRKLPSEEAADYFCRLFELRKSSNVIALAKSFVQKSFAVYFLGPGPIPSLAKDRGPGTGSGSFVGPEKGRGYRKSFVQDISTLDVWSDDESLATWGRLITFSGRAGDVVAEIASRSEGGDE